MPNSSDISSKAEKKAALLALLAGAVPPEGERPSLLEIDLWRRNKLSKKRSLEVKSYVARDTDCFQLWQDLLANEQQLEMEKKASRISFGQRLRSWVAGENKTWLGGGFAVATMAVFVAVVGLKSFLDPGMMPGIEQDYDQFSSNPIAANWHYKSNDKGLDFSLPTPYDQAKIAVSVGIRNGLVQLIDKNKLSKKEWNNIIDQYHAKLPDCPDSITAEHCNKQNQQLQKVGRWLALMQLNCSQTKTIEKVKYYDKQHKRITYFIDTLVDYPVIEPLTSQLQFWKKTADSNLFCKNVVTLLNHLDG